MSEKLELFVPGRLCLFGEHSDWAGLHRNINSAIIPGEAIVTGIEEGIYATAEAADKFIIESDLGEETFSCEMDTQLLRKTACEGGYFSYVAGVASYVNEHYSVGGLKIHITGRTLPMKSGLSSSAAICVLTARAFNQIYKLKLNTIGEMNIAFIGEQRTPSRCGRLDQACAFGVTPVHMVFDSNEISVKPIAIKKPLYMVIADLKAGKDTVKILSDLNKCYPFAENDKERAVHEALGADNREYIARADALLQAGDAKGLGELMVEVQANFDKKVAPACPSQLRSPVLHSVLNDENIQKWIYGAKGVGSQGDGTVQLLARDEECQKALIDYLNNERKMGAFPLTLRPKQQVRKAVIPVAGFGTRLYPASKAVKKDFLPVLDKDGLFKPVLMVLLEQLMQSGIEEVCLIIGEGERPLYEAFFAPMADENYDKLSQDKQAYENRLVEIGKKIHYVYQKERKGFGHAVYQSR
ncbi:MAG: sugar phosphate nucleotidyltransferase, partial [Lachnospiraceae bacterium]